ncbi:N-6 DNA methylase [Fodinibius sp.]|uniref:N-6 DNA methylase n=1 Tax=Fodinibius sp. TaxID=1872440 RepID=UPI002ACE5E66|nr:N-6 DNA methylase [Fodinibius sp.]MDZ7658053.1 N-6 DNA methylase [Fodinibius sp.]
MSTDNSDILKPLDRIQRRGYTMSKVFRDWVRLMLYALMRDDEKYLEVMERYPNDREKGEREADLFKKAFWILQDKMGKDSEMKANPKEYLGDCYMEIAGNYSVQGMGQYFTPQPVCDMMAQLTIPETEDQQPRVADPACGSGRLLHSAAKLLPTDAHFTGIDLDSICAHMAALNLTFFNMDGVIIYGNALSMKYFRGWITKRSPLGGKIRQMTEEELDEYRELRGEALKQAAETREKRPGPVAIEGNPEEMESQLALF